MSEITCDVIKDLMPGYIDGVLSVAGNAAVREHLESCGACRQFLAEMKEEMAPGQDGASISEQAALDGFKKIRRRTRWLKMAAMMGGLLAAALVLGVFLKVYVIGSLPWAASMRIDSAQYDEKTQSLTLQGTVNYAGTRVTRVAWRDSPSTGGRVDVFVYAADTLPFGREEREFSITIPDMKGKNAYLVGSDYDTFKAYDWNNDHCELLYSLEEEIYRRIPEWTREKVILSPVQGVFQMDGAEWIEYSAAYLSGEDAYYQRIGDQMLVYGDISSACEHVRISLEEPHEIRLYDRDMGGYQTVECAEQQQFREEKQE